MKTTTPKPTRSQHTALRQLCNHIPLRLVSDLAAQQTDAPKARSYSYWSQVVALMHAQFTHAVGLNDVCDSLRLHSGPLSAIRGATPPSRNNLSHANKHRPAAIAEQLFWRTLDHLRTQHPGFGTGRGGRGLAHRFKRPVHVVDSTTIQLVANCMDWARHRRRKAAAKCHLRLDLRSFLPSFAIVDTARDNDNKKAREVCAHIREGEVVLFDQAYVDFEHLCDLDERGVSWVTRAKDNMAFIMWAASTVAELYRCRWQIEVFFKQIKQTLQFGDFLGNSANAVRWQIWIALLVYVLLRIQAWGAQWAGSFVRLWASVRAALWLKIDLHSLLRCYGTAGGSFRLLCQPEQTFLPGLAA